MSISIALQALETLSSSPSTSSSGPLNVLLENHFATARSRLEAGDEPQAVISDLQKQVARAKKDVEKGLKTWYGALGNVGKAVDKSFPPNLPAVSQAYDDPPLFSAGDAPKALDRAVMDSLGRRGLWDAVEAMEEDTGQRSDEEKNKLSRELHGVIDDMESGDVSSALAWCTENALFLSSPPHPSPLPYYLHRSVFLNMKDSSEAIRYARKHLMPFVPTQPVLQLITSCLYPPAKDKPRSEEPMQSEGDTHVDDNIENGVNGDEPAPANGGDVEMTDGLREAPAEDAPKSPDTKGVNGHMNGSSGTSKDDESPYSYDSVPLIGMFRTEFCRRHGWSKEDPLEVVVDLGSRGGALNAIEKARKVMGDRLGSIRKWDELPMEVGLPSSRRYHSVFVCPVSKEQATDANPPKMLSCGHVIADESFNRLLKGGRRKAKCPYCPTETTQNDAQRLYF